MIEFINTAELFFPTDLVRAIHVAKRRANKSDGTDDGNQISSHLSKEDTEAILNILFDTFSEIQFVDLKPGLQYYYHTEPRPNRIRENYGPAEYNYYEVTQIGDETVVLKRLNENAKGGQGSTFVESKSKVEFDLLTGRAKVYDAKYVYGFQSAGDLIS